MDEKSLKELIEKVKSGAISTNDAIRVIKALPYEDIGFAKVDHHRGIRKGFPEVIFGEGKTPHQVKEIAASILRNNDRLLVTRSNADQFKLLSTEIPDAKFDSEAKLIFVNRTKAEVLRSGILVMCAGTSDLPVAKEACITAEMMGNKVRLISDVGVAGIHRLFDQQTYINNARVIVVIAGMEGALPSVIGGLAKAPIVAVPTSVGYGASFNGLAALLAMMNSCATGVGVVNVDNGFGGGYLASLINQLPSLNESIDNQ
ncbi:MAG: nickel pincer cofactor biosynthesis protein LarB [Dehalococcoidia bacterium]